MVRDKEEGRREGEGGGRKEGRREEERRGRREGEGGGKEREEGRRGRREGEKMEGCLLCIVWSVMYNPCLRQKQFVTNILEQTLLGYTSLVIRAKLTLAQEIQLVPNSFSL